MAATREEVRIELCYKHKDTDLQDFYPGYVFNQYLSFPARKCKMTGCTEDAFYSVIGIYIPPAVGKIEREYKYSRGTSEIYKEAVALMGGGDSLTKLTHYLKTRIIPSYHKEMTADKVIRHHARCILAKLNIDPECSLSDTDKHRILLELGLYPDEFEE